MYGYYIHVSEGGTIRENVAKHLVDGTVKHEPGPSFLDPKGGGYVWKWTPTGDRMQVFAGSGNALYWQSDDPVEAAKKLARDRVLVCVVEGTRDEAEQLAKVERAVHRLAAQIAEEEESFEAVANSTHASRARAQEEKIEADREAAFRFIDAKHRNSR